jgi:hypothetical protein
MRLLTALFLGVSICLTAWPQAQQKGIDPTKRSRDKIQIEYVGYRAATWEEEALEEVEHDRDNEGGLIYAYLTNISDQPQPVAFWRVNGHDESYWRLGRFIAWDRQWDQTIQPGQTTVLEINALTDDFAPGQPFNLSIISRASWMQVGRYKGTLEEDSVQISLMRLHPDMQTIDVHLRHTGDGEAQLAGVEVIGREVADVTWVGQNMSGKAYAIAQVKLAEPIPPSTLTIVKVGVTDEQGERHVMSHRRAFPDYFPIGTWSVNEEIYEVLRKLHIELVVRGGSPEDAFHTEVIPRYGFRTMVHYGFGGQDMIRALDGHPTVACWMVQDEPDWHTQSVVMLEKEKYARQFSGNVPTMMTLCRNIKFFEYASIADIPVHDHYCVTAPTSSKWPHPYGTRLEETGYYTRDLKAASEPKPIWVWTQGIAGWSERPKRPVPTPEELAAQLMFNVGRGAKGIIWFSYDHKPAEKYPDTRDEMQRWGRVLRMTRADLQETDAVDLNARGPEKVDVATLLSMDKLFVIATNQDYDIDPVAYPFREHKNVNVTIDLPEWIDPKAALLIDPDGVHDVPFDVKRGKAVVTVGDLYVTKMIVLLNDPADRAAYESEHAAALADEQRDW